MYFTRRFSVFILIFLLLCPVTVWGSTLQMDYEDKKLSLTTKDADLKSILLRLSREVGIGVWFPQSLNKRLTVELSGVSLERALKAILKGVSYATIYSRSRKTSKIRVSEVHVFRESKRRTTIWHSVGKSSRIESRINYYEKRLKSVQDKLDRAASGSALERRFQRQTRSIERTIARLKQQIQ